MIRYAFLAAVAFAVPAVSAPAAEENPIVTLVKSKVKEKDKPFSLIVTFKVKAGEEKAFEAAFQPCLAATRKEPGCLAYDLNRDTDHPELFVMYERFKSIAAIEEHAKTKHVEELFSKIGTLFEGAPQVKVYAAAGE